MHTNNFWHGDRVEMSYLDCSGHAFPKHYHDDYVIGVNTAGRERIWIDGKSLEAGPNDITIYNPGEVQASSGVGSVWAFVSLHVSPSLVTDSFSLMRPVAFTKSVVHCVPRARNLQAGISQVLDGSVPTNEIDEFVTLLLDGLFSMSSDLTQTRSEVSCYHVIRRCRERLMEDDGRMSLSDIATDCAVTPVQLVRMFKKELGLPPFRWRRIQRLLAAKRALRTKQSLSDLAISHGFSDQSHFTREFRKIFAITPAAYRRILNVM